MNTTIQASVARRTPDEIALELTMCRSRIRTQLETYPDGVNRESSREATPSNEISFSRQFMRTMGSAQRYAIAYLGRRGVHVTPLLALNFIRKRPLLIGFATTATVGIAVAIGPKRILTWVAKIIATWRLISALR